MTAYVGEGSPRYTKKKLIWETDWKHVNLISALFWKMDLKMDLKMDWY